MCDREMSGTINNQREDGCGEEGATCLHLEPSSAVWMSGGQLKAGNWTSEEKKDGSENCPSGKQEAELSVPSCIPAALPARTPAHLPLGLWAKSDSFLPTNSDATISNKSSPGRRSL